MKKKEFRRVKNRLLKIFSAVFFPPLIFSMMSKSAHGLPTLANAGLGFGIFVSIMILVGMAYSYYSKRMGWD